MKMADIRTKFVTQTGMGDGEWGMGNGEWGMGGKKITWGCV
ncbi:MAG: hypothetical protein ACJAZD_002698 [Ilumatobacter sp.]|jgi:hypothetical protein